MLRFVSIHFILFLSNLTSAGVRDVGSGGGFAEIQFIHYYANTKPLIQFCLNNTNLCHLNSEQQLKWKSLLTEIDSIKLKYSIGFKSDSLNNNETWIVSNNIIFIQQNYLYDKNDHEIPESQILSLALSIQLSLIDNASKNFEKTLSETQVNLNQINFQNKKIGFIAHSKTIYFHQLQLFVGSESMTLLALEDQFDSYNLNPLFKYSYPILDINHSQFNQVMGGLNSPQSGFFFGYIDDSRKFQIRFQLDSDWKIIKDSIKIQVADKN